MIDDVNQILAVTDVVADELPACCADCVFWQRPHRRTSARVKRRWGKVAERRFGPWGRVLRENGAFRGMIQYGPRSIFPRTRVMPAGPASSDAAVVTCVYLGTDDPAGMCERLFLEALADVQSRGYVAVEAFGLNYPEDVPHLDRFGSHHTLFDRDFLDGLGFVAIRSSGQVSLMRLEIADLPAASPGRVVALGHRVVGGISRRRVRSASA